MSLCALPRINLPLPTCRLCADIPFTKPVAGVRVGMSPDGERFIINPNASQMAASPLDLVMAGTADAVLMIEGFCDWLSEERMLEVRHNNASFCPFLPHFKYLLTWFELSVWQ
jgi:3' exoribonuclease family, domain 2